MRLIHSIARLRFLWLLAGLFLLPAAAFAEDEGYESIFEGKTLTGWDGNPDFWRVEDGTITGETTAEKPTKGNTFLIWRGGEPGDFELKAEFKISAHNSGIQYRSFEVKDAKWVVGGYQGDIDYGNKYTGSCYGEKFRGMLASRGQVTVIGEDHKPKVVGSLGESTDLANYVKKDEWNEFTITARGFHFVQQINGHPMAELTDEDNEQRRATGVIALQLHAGPPMKVQYRNIRLKRLPAISQAPAKARPGAPVVRTVSYLAPDSAATSAGVKKIVLIAGKPSHGFGAREHKAGCMLLAKALNESGLPLKTEVVTGGWPENTAILEDADAIVIYSDGGKGHPFNAHLPEIDKLMKKGVGLTCIHYAVEVPKGPSGEALLDWTGGYFEPDWSVNPHWTADYQKFPDHAISRGVTPFSINDEWYYHMRFRAGMEGVTPILSVLPPESSLARKDGPHSGNPAVREAVAKGEPQTMAWASTRPDGGRGFGFTGGHDHWNWGNDSFRKLVLNGIVWTAKLDVPADGVSSKTPTVAELVANQDEPVPANFNPDAIQKMLDTWNKK